MMSSTGVQQIKNAATNVITSIAKWRISRWWEDWAAETPNVLIDFEIVHIW